MQCAVAVQRSAFHTIRGAVGLPPGEAHVAPSLTNPWDTSMTLSPYHPKLSTRFLIKIAVDLVTDCWMWQAAADKDGYAVFWCEGRTVRGHRWAYQQARGVKLPPTIYARHTCDRPGCVNPAHIQAGTAQQNSNDMLKKGRQASKLSEHDVWSMRCLRHYADDTYEALAETFGVATETARQAVNGVTWKHVPCPCTEPAGTAPEFNVAGKTTSAYLQHNPPQRKAA